MKTGVFCDLPGNGSSNAWKSLEKHHLKEFLRIFRRTLVNDIDCLFPTILNSKNIVEISKPSSSSEFFFYSPYIFSYEIRHWWTAVSKESLLPHHQTVFSKSHKSENGTQNYRILRRPRSLFDKLWKVELLFLKANSIIKSIVWIVGKLLIIRDRQSLRLLLRLPFRFTIEIAIEIAILKKNVIVMVITKLKFRLHIQFLWRILFFKIISPTNFDRSVRIIKSFFSNLRDDKVSWILKKS